ncbi:MAG: helix-turn-helix domain-containing protein [Thermomicrobiales bacterium]
MTELTSRQRAVLALVATGATNAEIAAALGLSRQTVNGHLADAYQRLGVTDRTQAALAVVEPPVPLAGCLVFANRESALAALGGER